MNIKWALALTISLAVAASTQPVAQPQNGTSPSSLPSQACPYPTWPSAEVCGGRGVCTNGRCECADGWSGKHDLLRIEGQDCQTPVTGRFVLNIIAFVSGSLCIVACLYALMRHRRLILCRPKEREIASQRVIIQQYQLILTLVVACTVVFCECFFLFSNNKYEYFRDNTAAFVALYIAWMCQYTSSTMQCALLIRLSLDRATRRSQKVVLAAMNRGFWIMWFIGATCLTVSIPGGYFAQDNRTLTEVFGRMYAGVFGTTLFVCSFIVLKFAIEILGVMSKSITYFANPSTIAARDRLKLTIYRLFPALLLIGATNMLAAIFPPLLGVYLPFNGSVGCLNGIIRVRRELLPDSELYANKEIVESKSSTSLKTNSTTA